MRISSLHAAGDRVCANVLDLAQAVADGGIWRETDAGKVFAFLTCAPNPLVAPLHPKAMPVIAHRDDYRRWLEGGYDDVCALATAVPSRPS